MKLSGFVTLLIIIWEFVWTGGLYWLNKWTWAVGALLLTLRKIMSQGTTSSASRDKNKDEDKRIRQLYQTLVENRRLAYWTILDFPYLAEIVRHDCSYLRRILTSLFVDHPVLSQYLSNLAWREKAKSMSRCTKSKHMIYKCEMLPIGFERTLWLMYKRQTEISSVWSPPSSSSSSTALSSSQEFLPVLNFREFLHKIVGVSEC